MTVPPQQRRLRRAGSEIVKCVLWYTISQIGPRPSSLVVKIWGVGFESLLVARVRVPARAENPRTEIEEKMSPSRSMVAWACPPASCGDVQVFIFKLIRVVFTQVAVFKLFQVAQVQGRLRCREQQLGVRAQGSFTRSVMSTGLRNPGGPTSNIPHERSY